MIKQKAPKDMTVKEFVDLVGKRYMVGNGCNMDAWINTLRMIAEEPAKNPFTTDQLAVMRELQRNGLNYAAQDDGESTYLYCKMPTKDYGAGSWDTDENYENCPFVFLVEVLSWADPEPLCFADFAPIDNESTVS